MKINSKRKKVIIGGLLIFFLSAVYIPDEVRTQSSAQFLGYSFLWDIYGEVALKLLLVEWTAIGVIFAALFAISGDDE
jgi:hypothetical protein